MLKQIEAINKPFFWYFWVSAFFSAGVIFHVFEITRTWMLLLTPFVLLIIGILVILPLVESHFKPIYLWILSTYLVTFFLEWLGVKTGLVFGSYIYGSTLGLAFDGVPLIIGYNWVLVICGAIQVAVKLTDNPWFQSLIAALLALGFDIILEPVAIRLDYWHWAGNVIPLQNYIAWFTIALVFAGVYFLFFHKKSPLKGPFSYLLLVQTLFFLGLNLVLTS